MFLSWSSVSLFVSLSLLFHLGGTNSGFPLLAYAPAIKPAAHYLCVSSHYLRRRLCATRRWIILLLQPSWTLSWVRKFVSGRQSSSEWQTCEKRSWMSLFFPGFTGAPFPHSVVTVNSLWLKLFQSSALKSACSPETSFTELSFPYQDQLSISDCKTIISQCDFWFFLCWNNAYWQ